MIRLDVVVMAHKKREAFIPELLASLDRSSRVVYDKRNDRWDTGRRSWQAIDKSATHGLVLQDDAIVCKDLIAGVEQALEHVPEGSPLGLYAGRVRPFRDLVQQLVNQASSDTSWLTMAQLHWGVGIVLPTRRIDDMLAWCDQRTDVANYDKRISRWCQHRNLTVWYPWPSLVDHRRSPSLVPGRSHAGRYAYRFLGTDQSALDRPWGGRVVNIPALSQVENPNYPRYTGGPPVEFLSTKYPNLDLSNKPGLHGVRFRDGRCTVTRHNAISILQSKWWQRRGVRIATDHDRPPAKPQQVPATQPAALAETAAPETVPDPAPTPGEAPGAEGPDVAPNGTAAEVLTWVGDDPDRARQALDVEQARAKPRTTLVGKLEAVAAVTPAAVGAEATDHEA